MTAVPHSQQDSPQEPQILMALTRMEAKVDVALAQHGAKIDGLTTETQDHEVRLRAIEARRTITPAELWAVVLGALGAFVAISTLYERFIV